MGFPCETFFELQNVLNIPDRFELISEDLWAKFSTPEREFTLKFDEGFPSFPHYLLSLF
jgi:hypothetical protein